MLLDFLYTFIIKISLLPFYWTFEKLYYTLERKCYKREKIEIWKWKLRMIICNYIISQTHKKALLRIHPQQEKSNQSWPQKPTYIRKICIYLIETSKILRLRTRFPKENSSKSPISNLNTLNRKQLRYSSNFLFTFFSKGKYTIISSHSIFLNLSSRSYSKSRSKFVIIPILDESLNIAMIIRINYVIDKWKDKSKSTDWWNKSWIKWTRNTVWSCCISTLWYECTKLTENVRGNSSAYGEVIV